MTVKFTYNKTGRITINQVKSLIIDEELVSLTVYDYYSMVGDKVSPEQCVIHTSRPDLIKFDNVTNISCYD